MMKVSGQNLPQLNASQETGDHMSFSVVIRVHVNGILSQTWSEIVDSTTKSGATRKANGVVKSYGYEVESKTQIGNYQYWKVNY